MSALLQKGTATLVAGTITVSGVVVAADASIFVNVNTPAGAVQGVKYAVPTATRTATQFVINAVDAAGALVATDVSTVDWAVT